MCHKGTYNNLYIPQYIPIEITAGFETKQWELGGRISGKCDETTKIFGNVPKVGDQVEVKITKTTGSKYEVGLRASAAG